MTQQSVGPPGVTFADIELPPDEIEEAEVDASPEGQAVAQVKSQAASIVQAAERLKVETAADAESATGLLGQIARAKKDAEKRRRSIIDPINESLKNTRAMFAEALAPFEQADILARAKLLAYTKEQERRAAEEQARLDAERRKREEAEAKIRRQAEEAARLEREAAQLAADEAHAEMRRAEAEGNEEAADRAQLALESAEAAAQTAALAQQLTVEAPAAVIPAAQVAAPAPLRSASGASAHTRTVWKFEIEDPALVPDEYRTIDEKAIRADVTRKDNPVREIPGVRIYEDAALSVRAGA